MFYELFNSRYNACVKEAIVRVIDNSHVLLGLYCFIIVTDVCISRVLRTSVRANQLR